jgi:hypothetical protein
MFITHGVSSRRDWVYIISSRIDRGSRGVLETASTGFDDKSK